MDVWLSLIERERKKKGLVIYIHAQQKYTRVLGVGFYRDQGNIVVV